MIAYITSWIKDIILIVLFSVFLELLLPNSSMQKFVRIIMGLFILLAILNPIIGLIEEQAVPSQLPALSRQTDSNTTNANIVMTANKVVENREKLANAIYVRDLSKQIKATVMSIDGVGDAKVIVTLEPAAAPSKRLDKIKTVVVYIAPGISSNEQKITKITVGITVPKSEETTTELSAALVDKTTRTITELYQLKASQVEVRRMNLGG